MNLSAIILALEKIALIMEHKMEPNEKIASELETQAELLFRLAGRVRWGKENG